MDTGKLLMQYVFQRVWRLVRCDAFPGCAGCQHSKTGSRLDSGIFSLEQGVLRKLAGKFAQQVPCPVAALIAQSRNGQE